MAGKIDILAIYCFTINTEGTVYKSSQPEKQNNKKIRPGDRIFKLN
jgi:hypothetical protein